MELRPISFYNSLKEAKGRKEHGCFLVEGPKVISDLLDSDYPVEELLLDESKFRDIQAKFPVIARFPQTRILESRTFCKIVETQTSQGIVAVAPLPPKPQLKIENTLVLNGIQDPGNVGTLIRSAAAFGVAQILFDSETADPFSPKVIRSCVGAFARCLLRKSEDLLAEIASLKQAGFLVCALTANGNKEIGQGLQQKPIALVVGSEGSGIDPEILAIADVKLRIPIRNIESLNAAVAGSIAMFSIYQTS